MKGMVMMTYDDLILHIACRYAFYKQQEMNENMPTWSKDDDRRLLIAHTEFWMLSGKRRIGMDVEIPSINI